MGLRLVALALAAVVCADVTLDAACDPLRMPSSVASVFSADGESGDACAESCVPDCFCCSRSETAGPALALPPPTLLRQTAAATPASITAGIRPVSELPPLVRS
jgi:hypothetical protein